MSQFHTEKKIIPTMYALVTAANNSDREKSACQWTVDGFRKKANIIYYI